MISCICSISECQISRRAATGFLHVGDVRCPFYAQNTEIVAAIYDWWGRLDGVRQKLGRNNFFQKE